MIHLRKRSYFVADTMFATASDAVLSRIKMGTLLQLYNRCWLQAILYNAAAWQPENNSLAELEKMQLGLLRRILKVPQSTPKGAIFGELGILPIAYEVQKRNLMFFHKLLNSQNLAGQLLAHELQNCQINSWYWYIRRLLKMYNLPSTPSTVRTITQKSWKRQVEGKIQANFQEWYTREGLSKTKLNCLIRYKPLPSLAPYIQHLSRNQAATIFRLRTGMTTAANNYSTHPAVCTKCNEGLASDTHFFQTCTALRELREKHQIIDILEVFVDSANAQKMKDYAQFTLEAKLLPEFFSNDQRQ
jgi:hypothetical protein